MTSNPASRSARATTLAPRSWPSSPGLATRIRIRASVTPLLSHVSRAKGQPCRAQTGGGGVRHEPALMPRYICVACGAQFADRAEPPASCPICEDERQFVNPRGQTWTTPEALRRSHRNALRAEEPGLTGIGMEPSFAIGQRALLVRTPEGNVLWDCTSLLDGAVIEAVQAMGGIAAIAISHPHFYAAMVDWSHAFGRAPIYLPAAD